MSNIIDSIQLSGVTYDIVGSGGGGVPESAFTAYTAATDARIAEDEEVTAAGLNAINDRLSEDEEVTAAAFNELDEALSGKQDTLIAGRGISIANDTISFSLPISAGTGTKSIIEGSGTIASGDYSHAEGGSTIASGYHSHAEGGYTTASGFSSHAEGTRTTANGDSSHAEGYYTIAYNQSEHASGQFNVSNKANNTFGNSGNTLFSVGNGTSNNARHNAFEIRQNGDIYLTKDGQDVKLQDQLGGGGTVDQTIISGSTNAVAGGAVYNKFDEVEQVTAAALNNINDRLSEDEEVTSAGLNALNDKFDGMKLKKLTQAQYDALSGSTDSNTLYVIVN